MAKSSVNKYYRIECEPPKVEYWVKPPSGLEVSKDDAVELIWDLARYINGDDNAPMDVYTHEQANDYAWEVTMHRFHQMYLETSEYDSASKESIVAGVYFRDERAEYGFGKTPSHLFDLAKLVANTPLTEPDWFDGIDKGLDKLIEACKKVKRKISKAKV